MAEDTEAGIVPTQDQARPLVLHLIAKLAVGGATKCTLYQASQTPALGYDCLVVAGAERSPEGTMEDLAAELGVQVVQLACFKNTLLSPVSDLRTVRACRELIGDRPHVILHAHGGKGHFIGALVQRAVPRAKLVNQIHGWGWAQQPRTIRDRTLVAAERWAARRAALLGVVTTRDIEKGLRLGIGTPEKYRIMRSAVNLAAYTPWNPGARERARRLLGFSDDDLVVGSVGRLVPQKAPHRFIELAAHMADDRAVRFVMIGGGRRERAIRRHLRRRGLERRLLLLIGHRENVPELLLAMDLVVLLSDYEGMPRTLIEALASGVPVAARAVDGVNELIGSPVLGRLIPVGADTAATAEIVREALRECRFDEESVRARRARADEFSRRTGMLQTVAAYRELLGDAAPESDLSVLEDTGNDLGDASRPPAPAPRGASNAGDAVSSPVFNGPERRRG